MSTLQQRLTDLSTDIGTVVKLLKTQIQSAIAAAIQALEAGAPQALDTLGELATALQNDQTAVAAITVSLGNRVRSDVNNQGLTATQKQNARTNIDAYGSQEIGNPDTDLVAVFRTAAGIAA